MMLAILTAALLQSPQLACPVAGSPVDPTTAQSFFYKGVAYSICCAGCKGSLVQDPEKVLAKDHNGIIGLNLFDPLLQVAVKPVTAKSHTDYKGVRYFFTETLHKGKFDANPEKFLRVPAYEVVATCKETGKPAPIWQSLGYSDIQLNIDGKMQPVRAYYCCAVCKPSFLADPVKFLGETKPVKRAVVEITK